MTVVDSIGSGETQRIVNNDKVSVGLESGKAYIRGYEYESMGTNFVDMRKGRDTATSLNAVVNPNFGNYFRITNLTNSYDISTQSKIDLHCVAAADIVTTTQSTYELTKIGEKIQDKLIILLELPELMQFMIYMSMILILLVLLQPFFWNYQR